MVSIYFQQFFSTLSLLVLLFFNNSTSPTISNSESNFNKNLLGEWSYKLPVCSSDKQEDAVFVIRISEKFVMVYGNVLECNVCDRESYITANKIIFPDKRTSAFCTLKECNSEYKFCGDEKTLTYIFQDMEYELKGDVLILKSYGKTLELKRKS